MSSESARNAVPDVFHVEKKVLRPGDKIHFPKRGQQVTIHYTAAFLNKEVFDSSYLRRKPYSFRIGIDQTLKVFDIILRMSVGEHILIRAPWQLAYGERGLDKIVPPKTDVLFDIELLRIE